MHNQQLHDSYYTRHANIGLKENTTPNKKHTEEAVIPMSWRTGITDVHLTLHQARVTHNISAENIKVSVYALPLFRCGSIPAMSHDEVRIPYGSKRPLLVAAIIGYLERCPGHSIRKTALFASQECHTSEAWARFTLYDLERSGLVSINMCRKGAACFLTSPGETCLGVIPSE